MSASTILACLAIGVVSGAVAALCGVGGGVVMVPAFVCLLKLPHKTAVATSLAIIIPTALMATTQNAKHGFVDWKVATITAVSASGGSARLRVPQAARGRRPLPSRPEEKSDGGTNPAAGSQYSGPSVHVTDFRARLRQVGAEVRWYRGFSRKGPSRHPASHLTRVARD